MGGLKRTRWVKAGLPLTALVVLGPLVLILSAAGGDHQETRGVVESGATDVDVVSQVAGVPASSTAQHLACTAVDERANFRLYWLGKEFDGMPLTAVLRQCGEPPAKADVLGRGNSVSYIYGSCEIPVEGEGRCAPPLEIQVWPGCERKASYYEPQPRLQQRRGVPAAEVSSGMIEVYADSTIVVFADNSALAERAVAALDAMPTSATPADPPPDGQSDGGPLTPRPDGLNGGCLS